MEKNTVLSLQLFSIAFQEQCHCFDGVLLAACNLHSAISWSAGCTAALGLHTQQLCAYVPPCVLLRHCCYQLNLQLCGLPSPAALLGIPFKQCALGSRTTLAGPCSIVSRFKAQCFRRSIHVDKRKAFYAEFGVLSCVL